MGKIIILEETTRFPISLMGERAGVCWGADVTDRNKNYKRGLDCITSGHGRVMEYVNIEMIIDGYSARVIREWYTHIGGAPTRLQASTRYIDYSEFDYIEPATIKKDDCVSLLYNEFMNSVRVLYKQLTKVHNIPQEDATLILPLGMTTKIVDKRNLRNLIEMSHQRMCNRANWEYRIMFNDICQALKSLSDEWTYIVDHFFMPKCKINGYCSEKNTCGLMKRRN